MNSHRGHRGHNHFSVFSAPSVANSLHKFENWYKVCPTLLSLLVRGRFEREDDVIAAFTIFVNVDRVEVFDRYHGDHFDLRFRRPADDARRRAESVIAVKRAVEMNHERAALSVGLRPRSAQGIRYGLGHRFVLHPWGEIEALAPPPPLLFLLLVSLFLAPLVFMRSGMPLAHNFGESFEVIIQRARDIRGDQFSLRLGIWARRAEA